MVTHLKHIFSKKRFLMSLIRGRVKRKDTKDEPSFLPLSFTRKEEENSAGSGTSANDFKQSETPLAGGGREDGAIKSLYQDIPSIRNCLNCLPSSLGVISVVRLNHEGTVRDLRNRNFNSLLYYS
jgi:hypothetical protein